VEIADATGRVVRTMKTAGRAGINRVTWDLHYDAPTKIDLRTLPPDNPHIWDEPRFRNPTAANGRGGAPAPASDTARMDGTRADTTKRRALTRGITHWGIDAPVRTGPLVVPGTYTIRVKSGGQTATQTLQVVRGSNLKSSDLDLRASMAAQIRVHHAMNDAAAMANKLEIMRKQIEDRVAADSANGPVAQSLRDLDKKMMDVELRILSRSDLNTDDKWYVEPTKLYLTLVWLNGEIGTGAGDVAGGADYRPTDAELTVLASLEKDLASTKIAYSKLMTDVASFNKTMSGRVAAITETLPK
jgi:hypothetical protein